MSHHPTFDKRTVDQIHPDFVPTLLATDFTRHQEEGLPLTAGYVHFIPFVHADGTFTILNEAWKLDPAKWAGKTIRVAVDTAEQQLFVYHQADRDAIPTRIAQFDYLLSEKAVPLATCFERPGLPLWPTSI